MDPLAARAAQEGMTPMITDPIFYRLFETIPETFFLVLGLSADSAKEMAARTGEPVNTLLSRKHQAVLALREQLRELYEDR